MKNREKQEMSKPSRSYPNSSDLMFSRQQDLSEYDPKEIAGSIYKKRKSSDLFCFVLIEDWTCGNSLHFGDRGLTLKLGIAGQ